MKTITKLYSLLTPAEKKQTFFLLIMITIMALLDTIGVASILPFIAVLTNPSLIETNNILNTLFQISNMFGVKTTKEFLFVLGAAVFSILIISLTFKALTTYLQLKFILMREYSIGKRLLEVYLNQRYSWFLSRNSADLGKNILSEALIISRNGMGSLMELISKGMIVITLVTLLIIVDPKLALAVGLSFGFVYSLIFYFVRKYLDQIGKSRLKNNQLRFTAISEAFGAAKEIKFGGFEKNYVKSFSNYAKAYAKTQSSSDVITQLPRFILEAIAFGGVLLVILYMMVKTGNFNNALPLIGLYVFAGYRLIPALQQVYASFTTLTFVSPSLDKLFSDLKNIKFSNIYQNQEVLPFNKKITLNNICYNYPNTSRKALDDITLTIPAKSTVGFIGQTGCGKTTTVDIILGLLEPQKGTLEIDGKIITDNNRRTWQRSIGYVPQQIYLSDNTVSANIAFGVDAENINEDRIIKVSKIANLHDFVLNELDKQYHTIIGERGVRLSGGQRQRIGIARALYHNPKVLILDEATSSLDNETEKVVMEAVENLGKDMTIILIAHRLNTVENCDIIFKFDKGQLVEKKIYR